MNGGPSWIKDQLLPAVRRCAARLSSQSDMLLTLRFQKEICYLQCKLPRIHVCPVREDDHRQIVIRESLNGRTEPHGLAVVPHPFVALVRIKKPSESVADRPIIGLRRAARRHNRSQRRLHLELAELGVISQG